MKIFGNKFYHELSVSSEGLLFLNWSLAEFKEVKNCINIVIGRTNKKEKTAILIATLHKKHYFAHEYLLNEELVGVNLLEFFMCYGSSMNSN